MAFRPFELVLDPNGPNRKVITEHDGTETVTVLTAGVVDIVAVGELEDDVFYEAENVGNFAAEFKPASLHDDDPPRRFKYRGAGKRLLPRGFMAVATLQPRKRVPIWFWAAESGLTRIQVTEAPAA